MTNPYRIKLFKDKSLEVLEHLVNEWIKATPMQRRVETKMTANLEDELIVMIEYEVGTQL